MVRNLARNQVSIVNWYFSDERSTSNIFVPTDFLNNFQKFVFEEKFEFGKICLELRMRRALV